MQYCDCGKKQCYEMRNQIEDIVKEEQLNRSRFHAELSLAPHGSDFQQRVWKLLCEIPYGKTTTYGELAKRVAVQMGRETMSAQAVGGAVGRNPISIIIPCHRVVGADGSLTGYAGGLEKKLSLLQLESR